MSIFQLQTSVPVDGLLSVLLPEDYRGKTVRLNVTPEPVASMHCPKKLQDVLALAESVTVQTREWKFSREEANER